MDSTSDGKYTPKDMGYKATEKQLKASAHMKEYYLSLPKIKAFRTFLE
jgi:hypothetical protein